MKPLHCLHQRVIFLLPRKVIFQEFLIGTFHYRLPSVTYSTSTVEIVISSDLRKMSERKPISIILGQVHLSTLGVSNNLHVGSKQLDEVLASFANRMLSDMILSKSERISEHQNRPHLVSVGAPFDDDVATSSPQ